MLERVEDIVEKYFGKIVEIQRARLTMNLFLALAMITLTGFAVQYSKAELFLVASLIPLITLALDTLLRYRLLAPFLYKAASLEAGGVDKEPISLLYLSFGRQNYDGYKELFSEPEGPERQRQFRKRLF